MLFSIVSHEYPPRMSEIFDVIIWLSYTLFVMVIAPIVPSSTAQKGILLILVLSVATVVLAILQSLNIPIASEVIAPLYATERHMQDLTRRPTATTINPNIYAQFLALPLLVSFSLTLASGRPEASAWLRRRAAFFFTSFIFTAIGVLATYSRTGLLINILGALMVIALILLTGVGSVNWRKRIVAVSSVSFLVAFVAFLSIGEGIGRFSELTNPMEARSLQVRFDKWEQILPIISESPIIGYGPSKLELNSIPVSIIDSGTLAWWFHYGLLGVVSFLGLMIVIFVLGTQTLTNTRILDKSPVGWSAGVAVTGWTFGSLALWPIKPLPQSRRVFTLYLILVVFVIAIIRQEGDDKGSDST
ncbi:O-antigen ligase family protein [Halorussus litoreus]|uniref:O-antigen ligase family protein n=1 Tax=Halorussus litoreus TaxID=1710536 RepID=UPI0013007B4A|nr:O-antigen ligase family protein [Halorussus litoreus]